MKYLKQLFCVLVLLGNLAYGDSIDVSKPVQKEQGLAEWFKEKTEDFAKIFTDTGKNIDDALSTFVESIWKKTEPERQELRMYAEKKLKEVNKDLDQKVDKAKGILEEQAKVFTKALKEGLDTAEKVLSERSQEITAELKKELDHLVEDIKKQTNIMNDESKKS